MKTDTMLWTSTEAAAATQGKVNYPFQATGVTIDSRKVNAGDLFVAIQGELNDGHAYVAAAAAQGAVAAVVAKDPASFATAALPAHFSLLQVQDTTKALIALGHYRRQQCTQTKIVAVTGSLGKTTVREACAGALAAYAPCYATQGNLNNHFGTPLSLSRMPKESVYAVLELGMNHSGEIAALTQQVQPDVAIITTIAAVHLAHFASLDEIAAAKAEIFQGLRSGAIAILPKDSPYYTTLLQAAKAAGVQRSISFGSSDSKADCMLLSSHYNAQSAQEIKARCFGQEVSYSIAAKGKHHALNSLAVIASLYALDLAPAQLQKGLEALTKMGNVQGRGTYLSLPWQQGAITLIDEAYNASPLAVTAAIEALADVYQQQPKQGRRILALGDMFELGEKAADFHRQLQEPIAAAKIDVVVCVGSLMRALYDELCQHATTVQQKKNYYHCQTAAEAWPIVQGLLLADDVILIKGSNGMKMYELVKNLQR